jgi:AraC-like DNA-binding protein
MKLLYKQIHNSLSGRISARRAQVPCYDTQWHFHEELELIYIIKGSGTRFIGENISPFSDGELTLVGSKLPHLWRNDSTQFVNGEITPVDMIIVQFREDVLGNDFLNLNESSLIKNIFQQAKQGIQFSETIKRKIFKPLIKITESKNMESIIELLIILNLLSKDNYQLLSASYNESETENSDLTRIARIENYIKNRFRENISLTEVAGIANMSSNAFCRYFKKHTKYTLVEYVTELRIRYACKEIIKNNKKISEISYDSGFNSESLFNRQFTKIMNMKPRDYRQFHCST